MKYIFYPEKLEFVLVDMLNSNKYDSLEGDEFIDQLFVYLYSALNEEGDRKRIITKALRALNEKQRRHVMTIAESYILKGKKEGVKEGMQKGIKKGELKGSLRSRQETLIMLLSEKFGLSRYEKGFIRSVKDTKKLDEALKQLIKAEVKKKVFEIIE